MTPALIVEALRADLDRQGRAGPPGPFVPFVRDVEIIAAERGRALVTGHVNLNAMGAAVERCAAALSAHVSAMSLIALGTDEEVAPSHNAGEGK